MFIFAYQCTTNCFACYAFYPSCIHVYKKELVLNPSFLHKELEKISMQFYFSFFLNICCPPCSFPYSAQLASSILLFCVSWGCHSFFLQVHFQLLPWVSSFLILCRLHPFHACFGCWQWHHLYSLSFCSTTIDIVTFYFFSQLSTFATFCFVPLTTQVQLSFFK